MYDNTLYGLYEDVPLEGTMGFGLASQCTWSIIVCESALRTGLKRGMLTPLLLLNLAFSLLSDRSSETFADI